MVVRKNGASKLLNREQKLHLFLAHSPFPEGEVESPFVLSVEVLSVPVPLSKRTSSKLAEKCSCKKKVRSIKKRVDHVRTLCRKFIVRTYLGVEVGGLETLPLDGAVGQQAR